MNFIVKIIPQILIAFILIFSISISTAQNTIHNYKKQTNWQQNVDYNIDVKLDDVNHTLKGNIQFSYTNNSPNALSVIKFHLWANAYSSNYTAFAMQQKRNGSRDFVNSPAKDRGYMNGINFTSGGKKLLLNYLDKYKEWLEVTLIKPLQTGETVILETPFFVKLPKTFSRGGHIGQNYQITQWYPKPAVYDVNGWNMIHYLDQGEFYAEFGKFMVNITLPKNYRVAATGELQNESEKKFLDSLIELDSYTSKKQPSSAEYKTISYIQDKVTDFAWFANKRFNVYKDKVLLESGKKVDIYIFTPDINKGKIRFLKKNDKVKLSAPDKRKRIILDHVKKAVTYYSDNVGEYPYSHCTVVKGPLKAGGGMEYPMITIVANLGKDVITHEVGHNWFQGILGSNEHVFPWMDEGVNSFYEQECTHNKTDSLKNKSENKFMNFATAEGEALNIDNAMGDHSHHFSSNGYGLWVYMQTPIALKYLQGYLGKEVFKKCMKTYYEKWKFQHPLPKDMQNVFEQISGKKLDWFFVDMIEKNASVDYKIVKVASNNKKIGKQIIEVKNTKKSAPPFPILAKFENGTDSTFWIEGFEKGAKKLIEFNGKQAQSFTIDDNNQSGDKNIYNNHIDVEKGNFRSKLPKLKIGFSRNQLTQKYINILPAVSWNNNDGFMPGLLLTNAIGLKKVNYVLVPQYSIKNKSFAGFFDINSRIKMPGSKQNLILDLSGAMYGMAYNKRYQKVKVGATYDLLKNTLSKNLYKALKVNYHFINKDRFSFSKNTFFTENYFKVLDINYSRNNNIKNAKSEFMATTQLGIIQTNSTPLPIDDLPFYRVFAHIKKEFPYKTKRKKFKTSLFAGIAHTTKNVSDGRVSFRAGGMNSLSDITFSQPFLDRGALTSNSFWARQQMNDFGSIRIPAIAGLEFNALTLKMESTLPGKLFFRPYIDATISYRHINNSFSNRQWSYVVGLSVPVVEDVLEFYFPVYYDGGVKDYLETNNRTKFHQTINFKLNLTKATKLIYGFL